MTVMVPALPGLRRFGGDGYHENNDQKHAHDDE
jgi:hypothetical protein